jgi:hypothetical protein
VPELVAHAVVHAVVAVGVGQQDAHGGEDGRDVERRAPRALGGQGQGVQADAAAGVDVGVVDAGDEAEVGGFEGVAGKEGGGGGGEREAGGESTPPLRSNSLSLSLTGRAG